MRKAKLAQSLVALCGVLSAGALLTAGCSDTKAKGDGNGGGGAADGSGGLLIGNGGAHDQGSGGTDGDCGGQAVKAEPTVANLLFVIDRSGSMSGQMDADDAEVGTRWAAMVDALDGALDHVSEDLSLGLQFFPAAGSVGCTMPTSTEELTVSVAPGASAVTQIRTALSEAAPGGDTPAAAALQLAYEFFTEGDGKDLPGKSYVLLALDGGPNCNTDPELSCGEDSCTRNIEGTCPIDGNCCDGVTDHCLDDDRTEAQVQRLADAGIRTLVVGIPGSDAEPYVTVLDRLAVAGGAPASTTSPKYYKVEDPEALSDTMRRLTAELITSCELQLEQEPPDREMVNVFIDDEVLPKSDDTWDYDDTTDPPTIVIMGEACEGLKSSGAESVRVEFNCPTVIVR